ncbi:hypothetical protein L0P88_05020 [Muricauda sp. SCSIO 64092]|uniref:hypothetical protein n=1 Tax=Allomuricauda sp. SCSIO 64092 TaxID=2908842 RepID=UPI001FF2C977|nr:hypothetical protein [Muricauda sp. SCSIO 64092]UOY07912.1 hypothetical protein L0P88_05020 [Muricauda sp. SCSIO 64092]
MHRILKIILIVIGIIAAIMCFFMMPDAADPEAINSTGISVMFGIMWLLLVIAAVSALFFGLRKMLTTKGGLKKALFSLGGLVVLFIIGYALSNSEEAEAVVQTFAGRDIEPTTGTVKNIGMMLNVFFGMVLIAVALMIWPGIKKLIGR